MDDLGYIEKITLDDLDDDQKDLVNIVGLEIYKRLVFHYSGVNIYIPCLYNVQRRIRDEEIRQRYDGNNLKQLARTYRLCDAQLRNILFPKRSGQEK